MRTRHLNRATCVPEGTLHSNGMQDSDSRCQESTGTPLNLLYAEFIDFRALFDSVYTEKKNYPHAGRDGRFYSSELFLFFEVWEGQLEPVLILRLAKGPPQLNKTAEEVLLLKDLLIHATNRFQVQQVLTRLRRVATFETAHLTKAEAMKFRRRNGQWLLRSLRLLRRLAFASTSWFWFLESFSP